MKDLLFFFGRKKANEILEQWQCDIVMQSSIPDHQKEKYLLLGVLKKMISEN